MTISELKRYIEIDRRRLAPTENDCSDPKKYKKVKKDIKIITETDKKARSFSMWWAKNMFAYHEISLLFYVLACLPFLVFLLPMKGGEQIIYQTPEYGITIGRWGWLLYVFTCVLLGINAGWRSRTERRTIYIGVVLRYAVLIVCGYFGGFKCITLFGSEYTWFFVALIGGFAVTFVIRLFEGRRVAADSKEYDETVAQMNSTAILIKKCSTEFAELGDLREKELAEQFPNIAPAPRKPWFDFKRWYNSENILQFPVCRNVETNFTSPFTESSVTTNHSDSERDIDRTTDVVIYSQEFGYKNITADEAERLLSAGRIHPFFNLGVPEFVGDLEYKLFRHKWHYVKTMSSKGVLHKTREVESQAQKNFDNTMAMNEYALYKKYGKSIEELRKEMPETVAIYEAEKAKYRDRIGTTTEHFDERVNKSYSHESKGDEIGALEIRTSSGELLGLYCGSSLQSIQFAERIATRETDFSYELMMTCSGDAQRTFLYNKFVK